MVKCRCKHKMELLVEGEVVEIWYCPECARILHRSKNSGYQSWYIPEASKAEGA